VAGEDQRDAREADVAGEDRREAEPGERSNDSRHEQMDSCICSEGIRFLEAPWRAMMSASTAAVEVPTHRSTRRCAKRVQKRQVLRTRRPTDEMWWDPLGTSVLEHAGRS